MIRDSKLLLSDGQVMTETAASEIVDQGAAGDALGNELYLVVKTKDTDFTGGTSLQITLQTDSAVGFGTAEDKLVVPAIVLASLTKNKVLVQVRMPQGMKRYIRLLYTIVGTMATAKLDAFLTPNVEVRG
jgi:hypothetical protein